MRYKEFRIKNFKGIKDTKVTLSESGTASVFCFVGLNESGKTTILEAIHSFSPDKATSELVGGDAESGVPYTDRVPRHLISNFTGDVSVAATIALDDYDKAAVSARLLADGITVDRHNLPTEVVLERHGRFSNGDFVKSYLSLRNDIRVKTGRQKKYRSSSSEEKQLVKMAIYGRTPDIAYFPTFVFDFPKRIFLTENRGGRINQFYKSVFQDLLDFDGKGHTIDDSIVRRVRNEKMIIPWTNFLSAWGMHDDREKIEHVVDRASAAVTRVVFGRWNEIFSEDARGKEIIISFEPVEGEMTDTKGNIIKTHEHDIAIKFQIKDGTRRFDVNDRSLGFRWFFAFMLFTQFRVAREATLPVMFLLDEPASNLHAAAQQKLIESFPEIVKGKNTLAYTTHSHYMIEPKWLEQTFIVTNRSDAPTSSVLDALSLDDESLDVQAHSYRAFVNDHPSQTSYFQPILDRLKVVPSRFDLNRRSVVVEGKSDYYILRYATKLLGRAELPLIPALGAATFGALVALHMGWNLRTLFILDGDRKGKTERDRYVAQFGLPLEQTATIDELIPSANLIEDLLDDEAKQVIRDDLGLKGAPRKDQILRYFQERLASDEVRDLGPEFRGSLEKLLSQLESRLDGPTDNENS